MGTIGIPTGPDVSQGAAALGREIPAGTDAQLVIHDASQPNWQPIIRLVRGVK